MSLEVGVLNFWAGCILTGLLLGLVFATLFTDVDASNAPVTTKKVQFVCEVVGDDVTRANLKDHLVCVRRDEQ